MKTINILLIGPQGSGKSVQGRKLSSQYGIPYISTGKIFVDEIHQGTSFGRLIEPIIKKGEFITDDITIQIIEKRFAEKDVVKGFILDGFPRNIHQAKKMQEIAALTVVIHIKLTDEEAIKRISNRRVCISCNENFNIVTKIPQKDGICDACGGRLLLREDDTEEALRKRLYTYHQETEPILDFYRGSVVVVDGDQSIDEVFSSIDKEIKKSMS